MSVADAAAAAAAADDDDDASASDAAGKDTVTAASCIQRQQSVQIRRSTGRHEGYSAVYYDLGIAHLVRFDELGTIFDKMMLEYRILLPNCSVAKYCITLHVLKIKHQIPLNS